MYSRFVSRFYQNALDAGFQLMGADASSPSEATFFHLQKIELNTTFLYITVCDTSRADWQSLLQKDNERRTQVQGLLERVQNVALIYLLVEPSAKIDAAAVPVQLIEPYEGQAVYSVFWRLDLENGAITVPPGQPKELFGLRQLAKTAYDETITSAESFDAVSAAESLLNNTKPSNIIPIKKSLPKTPNPARTTNPARASTRKVNLMTRIRYLNFNMYPRYHHPLVCYTIIAVNLIVLIAMYMTGYPSGLSIADNLGIQYPMILYGNEWWRLLTALFVHFGPMHFIANTFGLVVFGTRVERYFGRLAFIAIYFISGLTGSLVSLANLRMSFAFFTISGGASGAVYGLVAAVFIFTRLTRREIETLNWYTMMIFIGIGLAMGFAIPGIDNAGHIGGLIGGALTGFGMLALLARKQ
jgi:membrane associated rhomboid family serine protease